MKERFTDTVMILLAALSLVSSEQSLKPSFSGNLPPIGINLTKFNGGSVDSSDLSALEFLAKSGYKTIALNPVYYQNSANSSIIEDSSSFSIRNLEEVIKESRSLGMKTALKPLIDSRDNGSRMAFYPSNFNKWAESYMKIINNLSRVAIDDSVDYFIVGSELEKILDRNPSFFDMVSSSLKDSGFKGKTIYAADFMSLSDLDRIKKLKETSIDIVGIDFYAPAMPSIPFGNKIPFYFVKKIYETLHPKPIFITEFGVPSETFGGILPFKNIPWSIQDSHLQAKVYKDFLEAISEINGKSQTIRGVFVWSSDRPDFGEDISDPLPKGYSIFGKPAEKIVKEFIKKGK